MADAVSQLQCQINTLCELMFNYAGTLQRDARPVRERTNASSTCESPQSFSTTDAEHVAIVHD